MGEALGAVSAGRLLARGSTEACGQAPGELTRQRPLSTCHCCFLLDLAATVNAKIASAGGKTGKALQDKLAERTKFTEEVLTQAKLKYLGHLKATYKDGKLTNEEPVLTKKKNTNANVTGEGRLAVVCGLIPRLNVYVYDALRVNAGVRASVVASAKYASRCVGTKAKADITLGLDGNLGVQVGGRIQPPGTSYAGSSCVGLGWDIGPIELANLQLPRVGPLKFSMKDGLSYCSDTCGNKKRDGFETDVDCGGGSCGACAKGKACSLNSDCAFGYCNAGRCSDGNHCGTSRRRS